ncbi:hypothetical protein C9374_006721 [Naegleria lovaniensis]|uniref:Uncharacterized protein n=1 Tax=Naegleria lovaniensis TaxID=51637 RepID=A0AA88KM84_NAELO|nr:uncharacterized protein C9374_006721 [Naegleria lovaniensis]KAG2379604.1 hypothetical protein C9374_006721 [Naegleria lovaniensis]
MSLPSTSYLLQSILVTGASRGIGLEFVKQLLQKTSCHTVCATCRNPSKAAELNELKQQFADRLMIETLDITADDSITRFVSLMSNKGIKFTLLFNNAGIMNWSDSMNETTRQEMLKTFETNTIGPVLVSQKIYNHQLLEKGALIANLSSILGSIELVQPYQANFTSYVVSKAALNMVSRLQSTAWKDVYTISFHPGWLQTEMGGSGADLPVAVGVSGMIKVIEQFDPETQNGQFIQYDGKQLAW